MAGITLAQAETNLAAWMAASEAVAKKQSYSINGRSLTLVNAAEIREMIAHWDSMVKQLSRAASGKGRVRYVRNA